MSLAVPETPAPHVPSSRPVLQRTGIIVIESTSVTPLGPRIIFANEDACALTGYTEKDLKGSPLGLIYDHRDLQGLIEKLPTIAQANDFCWMDRTLNRNGGSRSKVRWTIRPFVQEKSGSAFFTLTFSDIPGHHALPLAPSSSPEISPAESLAPNHQSTSPRQFSKEESLAITAGGVAHDFKNALQTIKSNLELAELVASSSGLFPPELDEHLGDAHAALSDAEALARQMLAFTKGGGAKNCVFDVGESLHRVARLTRAGSRIQNRVRIPSTLRPVTGDPDQIYQVFHNLVINASQAMPNGGTIDISAASIDFKSAVNSFAVAPGNYTAVSVRDRGCGIPPDILPRIFEPDFTTKQDGCGFGLASCRAIVEKHGGAIRVASKPGIGTEFLIFLPSTEAPLPPASLPPVEADRPQSRPRNKRPIPANARVLVVDDEIGVRKSTAHMLTHFGYEVVTAKDSPEALESFRRSWDSPEPIDLVILDMTLPGGLEGDEVLRELRAIDDQIKVIATSGYFEDDPSAEILSSGFTGVLAKPYSMDSLRITVTQTLAS